MSAAAGARPWWVGDDTRLCVRLWIFSSAADVNTRPQPSASHGYSRLTTDGDACGTSKAGGLGATGMAASEGAAWIECSLTRLVVASTATEAPAKLGRFWLSRVCLCVRNSAPSHDSDRAVALALPQ